ncbi:MULTISPECIES: DivIVA domain-containing protein [Enterococcus]|jgi:cell division initiation protein|uniref:Cell division protein DivIVA n=1 Tax=Enterococcus dispar ATCC 51266 TaxID=1139219 RepID=S1P4B0_9ENTE|nr:DivIVA domain-containing protein [Enterococcus dispar]EOT41160.1 cell division protein DivIVA [Enterococcus dispar ATCC 51266]EOW87206.1 cell division protein DivIVA [Enterococcus dispar ATCC 51266]MCU7356466.1 DivIVA domain-containing protein [Enterococcus dispar]MDT2704494.1 DivIVA domain-containing protein [Enterococcus dispar]WCG33751.1 DivIVA domain-containing protein [Enterococcus dispar]
MALTPLDINNKTFAVKMRGYNQDEVDDFLDIVGRDYEELLQKNREMEKALKHAEEKLEYFNELKDALNQSIIVAQDTADKVKTSASKESEVIVTSAQNRADELVSSAEKHAHELTTAAEQKAKEILNDASESARQLATETNDLKTKTRVFHQNLTLMLQSQLEQVKSPEWDEILKPFASYVQDGHEAFQELMEKELDKENPNEVNSNNDMTENQVDIVEASEKIITPSQEIPAVNTLDDAKELLNKIEEKDQK